MWVWAEVWEECGRKRWDFLYLNFASFHHVVCRSCLLSGIGRGTEAELGPDKPDCGRQQHWPWRGSGLVFGEDGEDPEKSVMRGEVRKYGSRLQTELVEGGVVKWVIGRLHRGLVLRCAKSIIQIWMNESWFFSFHWRPHNMWVSEEVWKHVVEGVEISCIWMLHNFTTFWRSLFAVRHWQRDWSTTRPLQTWFCFTTTLVMQGLRLGVWWGWWGSWGTSHERGGNKLWSQTELVEGEMVKWVKGRLHRGLVLRCAKSIIQIWVNLSLFFSFHWRPHDMW